MTNEEAVAQLNELLPDPFPINKWEQFKKLRSHLCETCHHAFEHHGVRMTGQSICWVAECNCREAK